MHLGGGELGYLVDQYGVPQKMTVAFLPRAEYTASHVRLEKLLGRKLTVTEQSAAESMESEHASYGSSKFYLKTLLPVNGPNHLASIGDEAASAAIFVDSMGRTITLDYNSESHNGPSYVCPHPGAATGAGGMFRDQAARNGRKPEAVYESRRQCHPAHNPHRDPVRQHTLETTKGIADYCNAMGVPHGDGAIKYHTNFSGNNLVNVMGITIATKESALRNTVPEFGDPSKFVAIYVGKASDTTGIGGTKFASVAIDMTNSDLNEKAVQDPDPHLQEAVIRGLEVLVDRSNVNGWKHMYSVKDMGAAGLLCSTVEQLHGLIGVTINGDLVPQNAARTSLELLEAETQERFFIYAHEDRAEEILDIFNNEIGLPSVNEGACAKIIGRCNASGRYTFIRDGVIDVDLPADDLKSGPMLTKPIREPERTLSIVPDSKPTLRQSIDAVLGSINFKSDAFIHQHYDKHVRSTNIVNRGEGCATLRTHELLEGKVGYSASFDSNAVYGLIDPKFQAEDSFLRAAWKMAAVGCSVIGVTNNANYGRTNVPEEMWAFVKGQEGIAKACNRWMLEPAYLEAISMDADIEQKLEKDTMRHVTVNSGNCSLNKANANTGTAIPPTTILGVVGWTNQPERYAAWNLQPEGSSLFLVGARSDDLGGSDYLQSVHGPQCIGEKLFEVNYAQSQREVNTIISAIRSGYVTAANNIEEGGLLNAVAELMANTDVPVQVHVDTAQKMSSDGSCGTWGKLFSESYGMVMQVKPSQIELFKQLMSANDVTAYKIGSVSPDHNGNGILGISSGAATDYLMERIPQQKIRELYHSKLESMLEAS